MRLMRVFPRRTKATPTDDLVRVGPPELWDEADEVHVSVAFTWDRQRAEWLAKQWQSVTSNVQIGGPAYDAFGEEFAPGQYLKPGYVITSRGCPQCCWYCHAWRREGRQIRELPIREGSNVLDNNLLACSQEHIEKVLSMLGRQSQRARFTGGLEAARLEDWHVEQLATLRPEVMFFSYDKPGDYEPLRRAGRMLRDADLLEGKHRARCYVLCGWKGDTRAAAEARMRATIRAGFMPMAMLYNRRMDADQDVWEWRRLQREWTNAWIVESKMREMSDVLDV